MKHRHLVGLAVLMLALQGAGRVGAPQAHVVAPVASSAVACITCHMPPVPFSPVPDPGDRVIYGAYLANAAAGCLDCHSPINPDGSHDRTRLGAGGRTFKGPWGVSVAGNLTADSETGLGTWTDAEIKRAVAEGVGRDGRKLKPPMAYDYHRKIAKEDLDALVAYLRTLKPVRDGNS